MRTTFVARLGAVALAGALLAACGGGAGSGGGTDYGSDSGATNDSTPAGGGSGDYGGYGGTDDSKDSAAAGAIKVADSDYGKILTDADGRALYGFTKDTEGTSTCYDKCEEAWPPLLTEDAPTALDDVDAAQLKTVDREDGSKQVAIGKWPLYHFASDSAAGDTKGQGVNNVWFLVSPDGKLIKS